MFSTECETTTDDATVRSKFVGELSISNMTTVKRLYNRSDAWLQGLPQGKYAAFLGLAGGVGVLIAGSLLRSAFILVQALTMAVVLFSMEYAFGLHQTAEG
ncbi:hypothetical protein [Haladaptatus sp. DYSN1]|uniref:hypothetical protein n=1 Tax=unclassified Haladaptatus TaxID=2622732 RepID=UPI002406FA35|nr:hypothetical protein [Haladaptatus sp. DYSN1]